jgi:ferritin-like metal-binding protein YciE
MDKDGVAMASSSDLMDDPRALYVFALQDLHDAVVALIERLPVILANADAPGLKEIIERDRERAVDKRNLLESNLRALGAKVRGGACVWMRAVLDDADNDAATIAAGPWRDVALVGALRKAKQAERVSYETAIALAKLVAASQAAALGSICDSESDMDGTLSDLLSALCDEGGCEPSS